MLMDKGKIILLIRCNKMYLPPGIGVKSLRIVKLVNSIESNKKNINKIIETLKQLGNECEYENLREAVNIKSFSRYNKNAGR
jgi:hypothetical protein